MGIIRNIANKLFNRSNSVNRSNGNEVSIDEEGRVVSGGGRYRNPLVLQRMNDVSNPEHRWQYATNSDLGKILVPNFIDRALAQPLSYWDGVGPKSTELAFSKMIQELLKSFDADEYFKRAGARFLAHGWQVTFPEFTYADQNEDDFEFMEENPYTETIQPENKGMFDQNRKLVGVSFEKCYSQHEIPLVQMRRANKGQVAHSKMLNAQDPNIPILKLNQIISYRISCKPILPMFQSEKNDQLHHIIENYPASKAFHTTRIKYNWGVGESVFSGVWDSIVKLTEQSENNHFRQGIFARVALNPDWTDQQAADFIKRAVYAMNNQEIFGYDPYVSAQDVIEWDRPKLEFNNQMENSAPVGRNGGSGSVFGNLNSDWAHLCAETGYSIRYFTGNPGGALAAATEDTLADIHNDIFRFKSFIDGLVKPFLQLLIEIGVLNLPIPLDQITIKTHWQVDLEEKERAAIAEAERANSLAERQLEQPKEEKEKEEPKKNEIIEIVKILNLGQEKTLNSFISYLDKQFEQWNNKTNKTNKNTDIIEYDEEVEKKEEEESKLNQLDRIFEEEFQKHMVLNGWIEVTNADWWDSFKKGAKSFEKGAKTAGSFLGFKMPTELSKIWESQKQSYQTAKSIFKKGSKLIKSWLSKDKKEETPEIEEQVEPKEETPDASVPTSEGDEGGKKPPTGGGPKDKDESFGKWEGVSSSSGNVVSSMYVPGEHQRDDRIFVKFAGGKEYMYSDKGSGVTGRDFGMKDVHEKIKEEGGEAIWEYMRAPKAIRAPHTVQQQKNPAHRHPQGIAKSSGQLAPYAGAEHYADYKMIAAPTSVPEGEDRDDAMADISEAFKQGKMNSLKSDYIMKMHDLEFFYGSKNKARQNLHVGVKKLNKIWTEPEQVERENRLTPTYDKEDEQYWYAIVNGFSTRNEFKYIVNGRIRVEYQCAEDIEKNVGLEVPLGIYHNLDDTSSTELPEHQIVGTYKVISFNKAEGIDVAVLKVDKKAVQEYFSKANMADWITPKFEKELVPDISTAYPATVHYNEDHKVYVQTGFMLNSVSFVEKGNCSAPYCTGDVVKFNSALRDCYQKNISVISKANPDWSYDQVIEESIKKCDKSKN